MAQIRMNRAGTRALNPLETTLGEDAVNRIMGGGNLPPIYEPSPEVTISRRKKIKAGEEAYFNYLNAPVESTSSPVRELQMNPEAYERGYRKGFTRSIAMGVVAIGISLGSAYFANRLNSVTLALPSAFFACTGIKYLVESKKRAGACGELEELRSLSQPNLL